MFVRYFDFLCCVACGLYLCAECNLEAVESSQDYMCGECAPGSVPDPQVEGRCQRVENIDTQDDLSNGDDNTGLIIGLVVGGIVLLTIVVLFVLYILHRRKTQKRSKYSVSFQAHKEAPKRPTSTVSAFDYNNPLYKAPEQVTEDCESENEEVQVMAASSTEQKVVYDPDEGTTSVVQEQHTAVAAFKFTSDDS
ncbi:uncharacterized protein LOC134195870 [Corticium candelabrum]|uniref:uncharacterized protein LOC134195870 n=1 Tax=Corticium candelabrum TaxID=121492 RepID=UPI002E25DD9F|nr:uncharacterized protein LOC134195870 [Corticium candelabrum]